eukprot:TRINITY_DN115840_c0_g1_i1.p1 TRINITY_DN115840_c0_g1~~TRINITY_DN115840_c0_g1_i1.p1  ORF type:complete len:460 (-),score=43.00 TRINITY_DN115840_c0_g1_i1:66-1445(-)
MGQVRVTKGGDCECYACVKQQPQQSFPVCTIRSTPSKPEHCIQWAKYIYSLLFCDPQKTSDNPMSDLRESLCFDGKNDDAREFSIRVFRRLFEDDVNTTEMIKHAELQGRDRPRAIVWNNEMQGSTEIDEQSVWSLEKCASFFVNTVTRIVLEQSVTVGQMEFCKDDPLAVDFMTAASNLRMHIFYIPLKSRWDIESIAGRIIPAVATTNAIVAGLQTAQIYHVLENTMRPNGQSESTNTLLYSKCRNNWLQLYDKNNRRAIMGEKLSKRRESCSACASLPACISVSSLKQWKIADFVHTVLQDALGVREPTLSLGGQVIWECVDEDDPEDQAPPNIFLDALKFFDGVVVNVMDTSKFTKVPPSEDCPSAKLYCTYDVIVYEDMDSSVSQNFTVIEKPTFFSTAKRSADSSEDEEGLVKKMRVADSVTEDDDLVVYSGKEIAKRLEVAVLLGSDPYVHV